MASEIEVIGKFKAADVAQQKRDYQHERLRSAVVEAAKAWERAMPLVADEGLKLTLAVDALNEFEAAVGQKEGE